jgi:hypothetical protein
LRGWSELPVLLSGSSNDAVFLGGESGCHRGEVVVWDALQRIADEAIVPSP